MPVYCIHVCITKQGLDSCGTPAWYPNINPQAPTCRLLTRAPSESSHTSTEGTSLWPTACSPLMMPRMHTCCVHASVPKQARYNHATLSWSPSTWCPGPALQAENSKNTGTGTHTGTSWWLFALRPRPGVSHQLCGACACETSQICVKLMQVLYRSRSPTSSCHQTHRLAVVTGQPS